MAGGASLWAGYPFRAVGGTSTTASTVCHVLIATVCPINSPATLFSVGPRLRNENPATCQKKRLMGIEPPSSRCQMTWLVGTMKEEERETSNLSAVLGKVAPILPRVRVHHCIAPSFPLSAGSGRVVASHAMLERAWSPSELPYQSNKGPRASVYIPAHRTPPRPSSQHGRQVILSASNVHNPSGQRGCQSKRSSCLQDIFGERGIPQGTMLGDGSYGGPTFMM